MYNYFREVSKDVYPNADRTNNELPSLMIYERVSLCSRKYIVDLYEFMLKTGTKPKILHDEHIKLATNNPETKKLSLKDFGIKPDLFNCKNDTVFGTSFVVVIYYAIAN